ncbi:MAG: hypothetical protein R3C59_08300 [Planctomycetaceae bacterium]
MRIYDISRLENPVAAGGFDSFSLEITATCLMKADTQATRRIVLIIGFVACFPSGPVRARRVWAQNAVEKRFDQLDRNGDGKITPDELPAAEFFKRLDLDGNGESRSRKRPRQRHAGPSTTC